MSTLPPLMRDQRKIDAEHLKLLAVFHFVLAGLAIVGLGFLFLHWFMMHTVLDSPELWKNQPKGGQPPPHEVFLIFQVFYFVFGTGIILGGVANLVSGLLILKRHGRLFSLIVAGLDCMLIPLGTVLGVFTLIVLLRESVHEVYLAAASQRSAFSSQQSV